MWEKMKKAGLVQIDAVNSMQASLTIEQEVQNFYVVNTKLVQLEWPLEKPELPVNKSFWKVFENWISLWAFRGCQ